MSFFEPLTASALLILAGASPECKLDKPTQIHVTPITKKTEYNYSRSLKDIQSVELTSPDPYGVHSLSITQGFMEGQIRMERTVALDYNLVNRGKEACIWYKDINVTIEITPTITIAREIKRDKCMFAAVLEHEKKHVYTDRQVVNDAAIAVAQRVYDKIKQDGFVYGPVKQKEAQPLATKLQQEIMKITEEEYMKMALDRNQRQQLIDSREEYDRVSALCPDFYDKKQRLYERAADAVRKKKGQ